MFATHRDVNGTGRVRVVASPYPTHRINIHHVPVSYSSGIRYAGTRLFFSYLRVSTSTRGYLQKYFNKQIFNHN